MTNRKVAVSGFNTAAKVVDEIPQPKTDIFWGRIMYEHIRKTQPEKVLELGTARGASSVFIASALEANGKGRLISVDSRNYISKNPTAQEVIDSASLSHRVTLDNRFSTYTWFLKTELERCRQESGAIKPEYDFVFIDGPKNWTTDGLAVLLAEKLLCPDGWLLMDDLGWSYEKHAKKSRHYQTEIAKLSKAERVEPHLSAVFELLVKGNQAFDDFVVQDNWWGWAHKSSNKTGSSRGHSKWLQKQASKRQKIFKRLLGRT